MKVRTLIADDEPLVRERLRDLLAREEEIELVGECADGLEALNSIQELVPELVFLDIQMPELDGFGVLQELGEQPKPVIVFVTAHDKFALRAFEVHAVDYLLKPFDRERFQKALRHALEQVRGQEGRALAQRQAEMLAELRPAAKMPERLAVKGSGRVVLVKIDDIDWVEAAHNYTELHVGRETHLLRGTLDGLEARLPSEKFVRISRSTIVNLERVNELQPLFHGEYAVLLRDGTRLTLSRRHRDKLPLLGLG